MNMTFIVYEVKTRKLITDTKSKLEVLEYLEVKDDKGNQVFDYTTVDEKEIMLNYWEQLYISGKLKWS